jgi:NAD(P)-dependent dehydrogenase (short-subunit alcohol dehydrogenase family)
MSYLDALFSLNGKVVLVTGSNRGIGYSLARGLARAGASVVLIIYVDGGITSAV